MDNPAASKADKFKRLAEPRVENTLKKIKILGNLASSGYEFAAEQVETIMTGLKSAIDEVEKTFQNGLNRQGHNDHGKFHL